MLTSVRSRELLCAAAQLGAGRVLERCLRERERRLCLPVSWERRSSPLRSPPGRGSLALALCSAAHSRGYNGAGEKQRGGRRAQGGAAAWPLSGANILVMRIPCTYSAANTLPIKLQAPPRPTSTSCARGRRAGRAASSTTTSCSFASTFASARPAGASVARHAGWSSAPRVQPPTGARRAGRARGSRAWTSSYGHYSPGWPLMQTLR